MSPVLIGQEVCWRWIAPALGLHLAGKSHRPSAMSFQPPSQLVGVCRRCGRAGDEGWINPVCPTLVERQKLIGNAGGVLPGALSDLGKARVGYLYRWEARTCAEIAANVVVSDQFFLA